MTRTQSTFRTLLLISVLAYVCAYLVNWDHSFTINRTQEKAYTAAFNSCHDTLGRMSNGGWKDTYTVLKACEAVASKKTGFVKKETNFLLPIARAVGYWKHD